MAEEQSYTEFKDYMRAATQEIEKSSAPCPSDNELFDYQAGSLDESRREEIQSHIINCGACRQAVLDVAAFLQTDAQNADRSEWAAFRRALEPSSNTRAPRRMFWAFQALTATFTVTTVLGFAWALGLYHEALEQQSARRAAEQRTLSLESEIAKLERSNVASPGLAAPLTSLELHDVFPVGSFSRSSGAHPPPPVRAKPGEPFLMVLNGAGQREYPSYEIEIRDSLDHTVWKNDGVQRDSQQNYTLLIPPGFLSPGEYLIRISGIRNATFKLLAEYRFRLVASPRTANQ